MSELDPRDLEYNRRRASEKCRWCWTRHRKGYRTSYTFENYIPERRW